LTLAELSVLLEGVPARTVWEALHDDERIGRLPADSRTRLVRTRAALERSLEQRDRLDPASWLEAAWVRLGGPAACRDEADLDRAEAFLAQLSTWASEPGWAGPLALAERLESLYAPAETPASDAVQIMTIHRAKGLEFDKVIVPGLGRRLRPNAEPLLRWLELPREPAGTDLLMAAIPPPWRRGDEPLTEYLKSLAAQRAENERVRLVYVAATRARSELHLYAEPPQAGARGAEAGPATGTLLAALWPAIGTALLEQASEDATAANGVGAGGDPGMTSSSRGPHLLRLTADWRLPELREAALDPEEPTSGRADPGIEEALSIFPASLDTPDDRIAHEAERVVCDQLRRCARTGRLPQPGSAALARALTERLSRRGLEAERLDDGTRRAQALFDACLADPKLQWIFSSRHVSVESPFRLSGLHDGRSVHVTVDRAFTDEAGVRWLVNFAVVGPPECSASASARVQLDRSLTLARALDGEPVRAGVYDPAAREFSDTRRDDP
ncbi:MAG: 3'-5' exonuclease, partial [Steroidobacteraceae bacterium]